MQIPTKCPSCSGKMIATDMSCTECGSVLNGRFSPCPICSLEPEMRELFDIFMHCRGNLKEVQKILQLSYPTVRNRIDRMFTAYEAGNPGNMGRMEILKKLRTGELNIEEAERLLERADR